MTNQGVPDNSLVWYKITILDNEVAGLFKVWIGTYWGGSVHQMGIPA